MGAYFAHRDFFMSVEGYGSLEAGFGAEWRKQIIGDDKYYSFSDENNLLA